MGQLHLFVGGMSCRRCVREVTARLRDVSGVEIVSASAVDSKVRLSGSMRLADVLAAFAGTTYRPRLNSSGNDGPSDETDGGEPDRGDPDRGEPGVSTGSRPVETAMRQRPASHRGDGGDAADHG